MKSVRVGDHLWVVSMGKGHILVDTMRSSKRACQAALMTYQKIRPEMLSEFSDAEMDEYFDKYAKNTHPTPVIIKVCIEMADE